MLGLAAACVLALGSQNALVAVATTQGRIVLGPGDLVSQCARIPSEVGGQDFLAPVARRSSQRPDSAQLLVRVDVGVTRDAGGCAGFRPTRVLYSGEASTFPTRWSAATAVAPEPTASLPQFRVTYQLASSSARTPPVPVVPLDIAWVAPR